MWRKCGSRWRRKEGKKARVRKASAVCRDRGWILSRTKRSLHVGVEEWCLNFGVEAVGVRQSDGINRQK